jgi:outer membrane immunogenic protein
MKRLTLAALAALTAAGMASSAFAADLPHPAYKAPLYVAPIFSWSGLYVGINGGYGWGHTSVTDPVGSTDISMKGALAGLTVGYNIQTGVWVWGVEGDIDYSWIRGTNTTDCVPGCESRLTWLGTARGRVGYSFGNFLPYLTGGLAIGSVKLTPDTTTDVSETKTHFGWTVGGGIEYSMFGTWSVKAEYLYADLGKTDCDATVCGGAGVSYKVAPLNIARLGVNYRF